jgi:murein DD-endopeptidase
MKSYLRNLFLIGLFTFGQTNTFCQTQTKILKSKIPKSINFIPIDSKLTAYYEIYVSNLSSDTITFTKVSVLDLKNTSPIYSSETLDLQNRIEKIGPYSELKNLDLLPSQTMVIYFELILPNDRIKEISHRINFQIVRKEISKEDSITTETSKCITGQQLVLGAPLKGGAWAAIFEPSWERGHRRVIYTVDGKGRIPGRYAIDFIKTDINVKNVNGDENLVKNWYGYGQQILAVADGVVSSVNNDFPESTTLAEHPDYDSNKATGNYITIKIGENQYAFYEHLKPNSINVKVGQKVKKGDNIALLGFTGQASEPHLHFHVANTNSSLGAEGLPFVFESFKKLGYYKNFDAFGKKEWKKLEEPNLNSRKKERISPNAVVEFKP